MAHGWPFRTKISKQGDQITVALGKILIRYVDAVSLFLVFIYRCTCKLALETLGMLYLYCSALWERKTFANLTLDTETEKETHIPFT